MENKRIGKLNRNQMKKGLFLKLRTYIEKNCLWLLQMNNKSMKLRELN